MTVISMTGYARADGVEGAYSWNWEAKSVNGKGLEVRCRLPQGADELEIPARRLAADRFTRGNISLGLTIRQVEGATRYAINRELLDQLVETATELARNAQGLSAPSLDGLLAVRGVVEPVNGDADPEARQDLNKAVMAGLERTLADLETMRAAEGGRIAEILESQLDRIEELCRKAEGTAEVQPEALKTKLREQISELLDADAGPLPEDRVAQEIALLLTKADVREEIDRLVAHLSAARELLGGGGAVGRRLDFLCQEFTREANTICSKAADIELTNVGLELKAVVEQFREQVQNIE